MQLSLRPLARAACLVLLSWVALGLAGCSSHAARSSTALAASAGSASASPSASPTPLQATLCSTPEKAGQGSGVTDQADRAVDAQEFDLAKQLYDGVLNSSTATPAERTCAANGLAVITVRTAKLPPASSAATTTSKSWDSFYADLVSPVVRFGTPALVAFALLLAASRWLTSRVVRDRTPGPRTRAWLSRAGLFWAYAVGIAALISAAISATVGFAAARGQSHEPGLRWLLEVDGAVVTLALLSVNALMCACGRKPRSARWELWAASLGLVLVPIWVWLRLTSKGPHDWHSPQAVALYSLLAALPGVVLVARIRGIQVGMRIEGRDKDGGDDAGVGEFVRVRLHALGSKPPRGIQVTQQTDVSTLPSSALTLLPDGMLAKVATLVAQAFLPSTPWRMLVTEQVDGSVSVVLVRNGRVAASSVIRRDQLGLTDTAAASSDKSSAAGDGATVELRTAAAAFTLLSLTDRYEYLREGLSGARDWRSVACEVISTDPAAGLSQKQKVALLAQAVAFDAGNIATQVAFLNVRYRDGATLEQTRAYAYGVRDLYSSPAIEWQPGMRALQLRVLFNLSVAWLNYATLLEITPADTTTRAGAITPDTADDAFETACEFAVALEDLLAKIKDTDQKNALARDMRPAAEYVRLAIRDRVGPTSVVHVERAEQMTMLAVYEYACLLVARGRPDDALVELDMATQVDSLRSWARQDTSLASLQRRVDSPEDRKRAQRFKSMVGDLTPASFLDLAPFSNQKNALNARGVTSASQLTRCSPAWLQAELGITGGLASHWRELALLAELLEGHSGPHRTGDATAMLFLLLQVDVSTRSDLRTRLAAGFGQFREAVAVAAVPYAAVAPGDEVLRAWQEGLR